MTKEQEIIEKLTNEEKIDFNTLVRKFKKEYIETVLNMLKEKEKDKEIEKLKKHNKELLRKLRNRVKEVKKLNKYSLYKKEFKTLSERLKEKDKKLEDKDNIITRQDKQIDLMAEFIAFDFEINSIVDVNTYKKKIKQYFKSKT